MARAAGAAVKQSVGAMSADIAKSVMTDYKQNARAPGIKVVMPGGRIVDASPYLAGRMKSADHSSVLADTIKHIDPMFLADHPGWHFIWPKADDKMLAARIRSKKYKYVPEEALKEGNDLPYFTHKTPKGDETVQVYDVVLCCVSPEIWADLYEIGQNMGVAALVGNYNMFQDEVDKMGGRADVWQEN